ncbi:lysophospholipid acyltransferase family protein [Pedobacter sp. NJ-S-72]
MVNTELLLHYHQQNRNIIAVLGHYGNWEYLNILPARLPFKVNAIYKPLSSPVMNKLVHYVRGRFGMQLLPANQALRYLLKQKDKSQLSIFLADQFPGVSEHAKFDFLHQSTNMFNGAEKLAIATNAVVVYLEMKRKPDNCWEIGFSLITESPKETCNQEITKCFADTSTYNQSRPFLLVMVTQTVEGINSISIHPLKPGTKTPLPALAATGH